MAISGEVTIRGAISASSTVQTWVWRTGYSTFFIQNLTIGTNTATDTALYFDQSTAIATSSITAYQLQAGQMIYVTFPGATNTISFFSTGAIPYQCWHE